MTDTSAVVFISTSQLLPKPGSAWRIIAGKVMRKNTRAGVIPNACPASISPRGTASIAPRKVSPIYAPKMKPMVVTPAANGLTST